MRNPSPSRPRAPVVLDIEASGFGRESYPIEVGVVLPSGEGFCTLIRPEAHWLHWDAQAQAVHGISRDAALRFGRSCTEVAQWLNGLLQGLTVYSDGWAHDYAWLNTLFEAAQCRPHFKLQHLRSLLTESEADAWESMKAQWLSAQSARGQRRHRASSDARLLQLTWLSVREQSERQHSGAQAHWPEPPWLDSLMQRELVPRSAQSEAFSDRLAGAAPESSARPGTERAG